MSVLLSQKGVAEQALMKIGAFSINDRGARGAELNRALSYLDFVMAHHFGSDRIFFLIPDTLDMDLTAGTAEYDIESILAANAPADGIQFPVSAKLEDSNGVQTGVDIITAEAYEAIDDKTVSGLPDAIFIDRLAGPTLWTYPVLGANQTGYSIKLRVQTFAPDVHGQKGGDATSLRVAWQLWAICEVARWIGDGPVRSLPRNDLDAWKKEAEGLKHELLAFENRQHATTQGRVQFKDF